MNIIKKIIKDNHLGADLKKGKFGIEKESVRVNGDGTLALTPHPVAFGDKNENPYITVDFSESQLEIITPVEETVEKAYNFLQNIHEIVTTNLENEYIWSQSAPPILPEEDKIPIAKFPKNRELEKYREDLAEKY
ncbi:MAG: bifunctional glutamate--cysteine ligase GshA/glutathione synthetase GshB, partial [Fusobacteriaceae bacterium]